MGNKKAYAAIGVRMAKTGGLKHMLASCIASEGIGLKGVQADLADYCALLLNGLRLTTA